MEGGRRRKTPQQLEEERNRILESQRVERLETEKNRMAEIENAKRTNVQDSLNEERKKNYAMSDQIHDVSEASRRDEGVFAEYDEKPPRARRGEAARKATEKAENEASINRQYRDDTHRFGARKLAHHKAASTSSLAEMRHLLASPRAPALLLSDCEDEETRRSETYCPPPPPSARQGRASALWGTCAVSGCGSGDTR